MSIVNSMLDAAREELALPPQPLDSLDAAAPQPPVDFGPKRQSAAQPSLWQRFQLWRRGELHSGDAIFNEDVPSWLASLVIHLVIFIAMALIGLSTETGRKLLTVLLNSEPEETLTLPEEFAYSEMPADSIGSSISGMSDTLVTEFPLLGPTAVAPTEFDVPIQMNVDLASASIAERVRIADDVRVATGPRFAENLTIKGLPGAGATGTGGAIDRITQEIILSLEERPTVVVWLFDASGSLARQRAELVERFERIYKELGVIEESGKPAFANHAEQPLLSTVISFGQKVNFLTPKPTDDVAALRAAVQSIRTDDSGVERTFEAVYQAVQRHSKFRTDEPRRNVMLVVFTDEVGDDERQLDRDVALCRNFEIPVYCVGVPAPFGRKNAMIKYVDPDPKFDQSPQWVAVRQGPESFLPELINLGSEEEVEPMDSGFGPYSLTRLCYETGGIFFAVHPNRTQAKVVTRRETAVLSAHLDYFFDPELMRGYRPDYLPIKEYQKLIAENKARSSLVEAAQLSWVTPMSKPQLNFPKVNEAELAKKLSEAQRDAAVLEPKIHQLYTILKRGEPDRPQLTRPRWQAGYDLSMGRVMALKVRTESYNMMLARAKMGMQFKNPADDTWRLVPSNEVSVSSALEAMAAEARVYLQRVVREHEGTPWALIAERELKEPFGWTWTEAYTNVNPPPRPPANNNNKAPPPKDDKARSIPRPEKRPVPKL